MNLKNWKNEIKNYLNKKNCQIANFITDTKIYLKKVNFEYGYTISVLIILFMLSLNCIIWILFKINYLGRIYSFIFLNKESPEWISGLGTFTAALIALHKIVANSKPGLRFHIDRDNVCVEVIPNSDKGGFALLKHICVGDKTYNTMPIDLISSYKNSTYSEPFGYGKKALIYLKRGKNDDRLRPLIQLAELYENKGYRYIIVRIAINDHIKPISQKIDVNQLKNERWKHGKSYYHKINEQREKQFNKTDKMIQKLTTRLK